MGVIITPNEDGSRTYTLTGTSLGLSIPPEQQDIVQKKPSIANGGLLLNGHTTSGQNDIWQNKGYFG